MYMYGRFGIGRQKCRDRDDVAIHREEEKRDDKAEPIHLFALWLREERSIFLGSIEERQRRHLDAARGRAASL